MIYSTHINFSGKVIAHDRNATGYHVQFNADLTYAVIWVRNPNAIEVLNVKNNTNSNMFVIRGL